ncbi:MAG: hypothetical protein HY238_07940 [Acidobacteria bacterium]|nr:hypothetical protein [Acidobacteriota bacterium]
MHFGLPSRRATKLGLACTLPIVLCAAPCLWGQEQEKSEVRLVVKNPPPDLPPGRTIVALSRLLGHRTTTARSCEGGAERGRHVRPGEERAGIHIDSPILSSKGPFEDPDPSGCGYGKTIVPEHRGTDGDDTFILGAENDRVDALGGNDRIDGGPGDDVLYGGPGNDILLGGEGNDVLVGGEGNDNLFGGPGNDRLDGGPGDDVLEGGPGDDLLEGGPGNDTLFGDEGDDILMGGPGDDVLEGGPGNDTLFGGEGNDELDGGPGDDRLVGGEGDDWLRGEAGNDVLEGGPGNDRLEGQDGRDILDGGPGNDTLDGGDDADILMGGEGDDILKGGDGDDILDGGPGNDKLYGGDGNDRLDGGPGDDLLEGGDGDDILVGGAGADRLLGGEGNDILQGGPGNDILIGDVGDDFLDGGADDDQLFGGDGNDILRGGPGNDLLVGGRGADVINGGDGDDTILLNAGDVDAGQEEIIDGGPGNDTLALNGFVPSLISGSPGASSTFVIKDPVTSGTYRVSNVERIRYTHWLSYLGSGEQLASTVLLTNPSSRQEASGRIDFLTPDGKPLELSIGGAAAKSSLEFRLPPLASAEFQTAGSGQPVTGRARIEADQPLAGAVRFSAPNLGTTNLAESLLTDAFAVPVIRDRARGISTGIFVINGETGGFYELSLRLPTGAAPDETDITMPPNSHMLRYVEELFPDIEDFQGTLWLSGSSLAAFAVLKSGNDFTVLPVVRSGRVPVAVQAVQAAQAEPVKPALPGRSLYFAHFAGGKGAASTFFVINPSITQRAKGTLDFLGSDGNPMAAPIEGRGSVSSLGFDLAPGGSITYRTDSQAAPVEGSARVLMKENSVEAVVHYSDGAAGSVGLGPSGPYNGFIAPVKRRPANGINTRIVVSSTGPAAVLQFLLRDARGQLVPGGAASVPLPANGHLSRSLEELFPKAGTAELQGAVTVTAGNDASLSATVLQHEEGKLASLPVIQLQ